jgi:Caspase domain
MSRIPFRFKSLLLCAGLMAGLLGFSRGPAFAETAAAPDQPAAAQSLQGPEQRVALVIGNSNYQNVAQLPNPDNDAQSMAQFLNSAGFEVIEAMDLAQNDMIKVVQDFSAKVAAHGPNTVAMIYYAGHGVQLAGENYLIPVDAKITSPADLANNSVRLVDVMATLEAIPSRLRIVVLDACRNNPFPTVNDAGRGLAIVDAPNGSIVGYSTAPGAEALDGSGGHSPYTAAFLRDAREPNVPIEQLFKRVRLDVNHATEGQQTPWESSSATSDFYFFGDTAVAATRAPNRGPVVQMASNLPNRSVRQAYDFVMSEGQPQYYQEFIQMFPDDPLCVRVRWLLANILEAAAWHNAVLLNSPLAYKAFYEAHVNSPYAMAAMKLQMQPKVLALTQPTHLILPQHLLPTVTQGTAVNNKLVTLPNSGNTTTPANGVAPINGTTVGKVITLPTNGNAPANTTTTGKILTLPTSTGGNAPVNSTTGGKIVTLPVQTLNKTVTTGTLKTGGPTNKIVETPVVKQEYKSELKVDRHDDRVIKFNNNNNAGQFNAGPKTNQGNVRPQNISVPSKPAGGMTTNNSAPRFAMGGNGGRRGF